MSNSPQATEYLLLGRLQQDCDYYLGAGARNKRHLWALDEALQIHKMKELYDCLAIKPEWLTLEAINEYERQFMRTPIQRLAAQPHLNYRVQRKAMNSARLLPPVGQKFSLQESTALREWVVAAGFQAWVDRQSILVVGEDAPDIPDGLAEQRLAKAASKAAALQERAESVAAARTNEYRELPASQWIEVAMGSEFANQFNKLMLARFLDDKDDFGGLMGSGWIDPLTALGMQPLNSQFETREVLVFLKQAYDKSGTMLRAINPEQ